jgi:hypothetical protein
LLLTASAALADSSKPPPGAPWTMNFGAALEAASKNGKPLFLYFTKTY